MIYIQVISFCLNDNFPKKNFIKYVSLLNLGLIDRVEGRMNTFATKEELDISTMDCAKSVDMHQVTHYCTKFIVSFKYSLI